jgi:hypothetical protein
MNHFIVPSLHFVWVSQRLKDPGGRIEFVDCYKIERDQLESFLW